jgi:hypothetical protein
MEYSSLNDNSKNLNKIKIQGIIVSCYFKLVKSKANHDFYLQHMSRFLKNIPGRIIFFTTPDMNDFIIRERGNLDIDIINIESVYEIKAFKKKSMDFWTEQIKLSPHNMHSPELIAIWFNKKEFVKEAIEYFSKKYSDLQVDNNNLLSDKNELSNQNIPFIWCDAGSIRSDQWLNNLKNFGNNLQLLQKDKLNMQLLNVNNQNKYFFEFSDVFIAGGLIAGYKNAWEECSDLYDNMIEEYSNKSLTCEMDQYIWMSCAQKNPEKFNLILFNDSFNSYDKWFFFYSIL